MKITGSDLIVRALQAEGVDTVFAIAGDHTLPLMDAMADQGFRFIDTRHEQGAVDMANAWARVTGKAAVSMFTTPGHANAIPGLTLASHMESPVVNIAGCADQSLLGKGAPQEIDQVGMARPVTKGAWLLSDPHRIPEYLARAFRTAYSGRRGPVHLTIPIDVQQAVVDDGDVRLYDVSEYRATGQSLGDPARVRQAIELLQRARRPAIIAGNGAYSASGDDLQRLIDVTRMPLFTEEAARGLVPDDHPYCVGYADGRLCDAPALLHTVDVLLLLGKKLDFMVSYGGEPMLDRDVRIIQVEPAADLIGGPRGVDVAVVGDVGAVLRQLAEEAEGRHWKEQPILEELQSARDAQMRSLDDKATGAPQLNSMTVHRALRPLLDSSACLVFEGSDFGFYGAAYYPSLIPRRWFTNGTLGMLGWGIPFGIGAQAALPNSKVVVLAGDGSFGFNGMEIDTAVRHNLPVTVVVGSDGVWGIDYHQQVQLFGKAVATELLPTRYDKIAEAMGAHGEYVERADQLPGALERALSSNKPAVVNVKTQPSASPLTEWVLRTKGGAAETN